MLNKKIAFALGAYYHHSSIRARANAAFKSLEDAADLETLGGLME